MSFLQLFSNCTICSHCNIFCRTWRRGWEHRIHSFCLCIFFFLAFGAEVGSEAEEERGL